jgi:diguanylate cyclase (GGDEF)-like protein/putative nucleotidyltransferase with HDIG domain
MSPSSGQGLIERGRTPEQPDIAAPAVAPLPPRVPWADEPRETSGMTSRLILGYVERRGGRPAVEQVLRLCELEDAEADLRNEGHWFSFATKIRLFLAAAEVLDDPQVARHAGECALELNVGEALKLALRALGSPRLVYDNIVRANGKFTTTARMDLLESGSSHARIAYVDITGTPFHPIDCQYNQGMLSCVPVLFGLPLGRVSHPVCAGDGGESCIYDITWESGGSYVRFALTSLLGGAAMVATAGAAEPSLLPAAGVLAAGLGGLAIQRALAVRRRVWRQLESEVREQAQVAERLNASLQDIVSELRLEDVLAKVTANLQSTLEGRQFALLVDEGDGPSCTRSSALPGESVDALERWAASTPRARHSSLVLEDLSTLPELAALTESTELPLRSLCTAPLTYRGRSLGLLVALAPNARVFLPRDVDVLQSFATQAAIALTNARLYEAQQDLASRDPLTGLLNHREFHESVARELERCRRYGGRMSVALFDLDGFKAVNDVSGHAEGDRVLRQTAEVLSDSCRSSDVAFRIGGDEFALLLPETAAADASTVAERAASKLGSSFGVAVWPDDGPTKEGLLARADTNLYGMKRARRGKCRQPAGAPNGPQGTERERLAVASRLSARLAALQDPKEIPRVTVEELWKSFGSYLAVILRLHEDGKLRPAAGAGDLVHEMPSFEDWEQSLHEGVIGRVARTGEPALVADIRLDPDFIGIDTQRDGGSELAVPIRVAGEIWGVLNLDSLETGSFGEADLLLVDTLAAHVGSALHRSSLISELESTFTTTLAVLSDALEAKDSYTAAHADDVADVAVRVARRLGLEEEEQRTVRYGALLHDIGKIGVRSEVLRKPGRLTAEEFEEIKQHTVIGAKMLERIPFFARVRPIVRSAHERWDGHGYPDGLAGEEIPLGARIVCACDAFHAMTSDRPYRKARSVEEAAEELRRCAGSQFDSRVVDALLAEVQCAVRRAQCAEG